MSRSDAPGTPKTPHSVHPVPLRTKLVGVQGVFSGVSGPSPRMTKGLENQAFIYSSPVGL